jgi:hypothetical protein
VWVTDRGFSSAENRRYLRQGDHAYIIGEKLRSGSPEVKAALSRQGRYTRIHQNLRVKEVRICDTERFVICHNPEAADRDHQQYLSCDKNPNGYCGVGGTGVTCPVGIARAE